MSHLYVCHFSNGHIKVGRSIDPVSRIAQHEERVSCMGVELIEHHIVECVTASEPREARLIALCAAEATKRHKNEWFEGLDYLAACNWAQDCARCQLPGDIRMSTIKAIRELLGLTQFALGESIGCTQGNVGHYERGMTMPPDMAKRLIELAKTHGVDLTMDQVYGMAPLPDAPNPPGAPSLPTPAETKQAA